MALIDHFIQPESNCKLISRHSQLPEAEEVSVFKPGSGFRFLLVFSKSASWKGRFWNIHEL